MTRAWLVAFGVASVASVASAGAAEKQGAAKGPYVTSVSDTTATVRLELRTAAAIALDVIPEGPPVGAGGAAPVHFASAPAATMHVVGATGLSPATRYAYTVRAGGAVVASGHFSTAPARDSADTTTAHTFIVYGDDRTDDDAHAAIVRAIARTPSDFLVNTGDLVADGGSAANWTTFFDIERDLLCERPLFAAIGNHELYDDAAGANFSRYFGFADAGGVMRPYGTVRFGAARFFFLNGMHDWDGGPEREWLERELSSADHEPGLVWRFAVVHQGPWSSGPHGPNAKLAAAHVPELLAAHHIDLVFSGHDHIYERGDAGLLKYIVSGGGGAPLYRDIHPTPTTRKAEAAHHFIVVTTRGDAFQMTAQRLDGSVLDRCGFSGGSSKDGAWDCDPAPAPSVAPSLSPASSPVPSRVPSPDPSSGQPPPSAPSRPAACACDALGRGDGGGAEGSFGAYAACASMLLFGGSVRRYARRRCAPSPRPSRV
jgi:hypothetical protein